MADARSQEDMGAAVYTPNATMRPPNRDRRALRITLLSLAAAILLLGAAVAAVFGYITISHGSSAAGAVVGTGTP